VGENAARIKGMVAEVWSGGAKSPRGSKKLSAKCGLVDENAARVKEIVGEVWSCGRKRFAGQEGRRRSVV